MTTATSALTGSTATTGTTSSGPVTTAATTASQSQTKLDQNMSYFLNMLVTQLKNQDPLNPMKPEEFTNQLVQFSSVEQQINANSNLEKMISLQKANNVSSVVNYIGKTVEVSGGNLTLQNGQSGGSYTLGANATKTTIIIKDSSGNTVFNTSGETSKGRHDFTWDGTNNQGYKAPDGDYTVTISAVDGSGKPVDVSQTTTGVVNSVSMQNGTAELYVGNNMVPLDNVVTIGGMPSSTTNTISSSTTGG